MNLFKSKRLLSLAEKLRVLIDKLTGLQGQLAELAEDYVAPTCPYCGAKLENQVYCPECEKREQ